MDELTYFNKYNYFMVSLLTSRRPVRHFLLSKF